MRKFLKMLEKDTHALSLARVCALMCFILFFCVTVFVVLTGKTFTEYKTLAYVMVGLLCISLLNKSVEILGSLKVSSEKKDDEVMKK